MKIVTIAAMLALAAPPASAEMTKAQRQEAVDMATIVYLDAFGCEISKAKELVVAVTAKAREALGLNMDLTVEAITERAVRHNMLLEEQKQWLEYCYNAERAYNGAGQ